MEKLWPRFRDPSRQVKFQELPLLPVEILHRLTLQSSGKPNVKNKGLNSLSFKMPMRAVLLWNKVKTVQSISFRNQMEHAKTMKHYIFSYASQWLYRYLLYRFEHLIRQNVWGCKKYFLQKHRDQVMETPQNTKRQRYKGVVGFLGYPQPGGGAHPPIPGERGLGEVLWRLGWSSFETAHKNTRFRVVRAAGA